MKKFLSIFLALVMLSSVTAGVDFSAFATVKTQKEGVDWAYSQLGEVLDYDGIYGVQCVDLIFYYYEFLGVAVEGGSGNDFIDNDLPEGWVRVYDDFQPGDIAVWKVNHECDTCTTYEYGHVGIITSADSKYFNAVNLNYSGNNYCTENKYYTSALACAIRPNWGEATTESIVFENESTTSIGNNCATVNFNISNPKSMTVSKIGIRIRKFNDTTWFLRWENQTSTNNTFSKSWLVDASNFKFELCDGTNYVWQPFVEADGKKYYGSTNRFKTTGEEKPTKPRATSITAISGFMDGFTVSWNKIDETTGYQVRYATRSDFSNAAIVYAGPKDTLSKTITGRAINTKYYVEVRTYKNLGNGEYLWGDWSSPWAVVTVPPIPSINTVGLEAGGFTVNWSTVKEAITGYQIEYATRSDFSNGAVVYAGNASATSKTITGRANGTKYYLRIRAYKKTGNEYTFYPWSSAKSVTTPSKPATTRITSVAGVSNGFTVKWNRVSDTTGYQIQYATRSDFSNAATIYGGAASATGKTVTGRAAKTKYYVRVRTYKNINGNYVWGDWSSASAVTTK